MITVIHVDTERTWRGGEGQVLKLALGLKEHGFRSVIAAPRKSALMDKAILHNLPIVELRSTKELSIRQINDLRSAVKSFDARLIHVHTSHGLVSADVVRRLTPREIKVIYSRRTDFHLRTGFMRLSQKKYVWCSDKILAVSDGIKRILISDGIPADMITTIHSGIDLSHFDPELNSPSVRAEFQIDEESIVVGMVAALVPHKDPFTFLRAAEIVGSQHPGVEFLLVGAGSMREDLEGALEASSLKSRFRMTGFRTDIPQCLAAMDIFCMSSREEGLCTSILDAMAMGRAVVATRAGGIPEAVEDNVTGLLVPVEDPDAFAGAVSRLVDDPGRRRAMGMAGRERVRQMFDIRDTVAKTALIYRELLDGQH